MKKICLRQLVLLGLFALLPGNALAQQSSTHDNQTVLKTSIPYGLFSVFVNNEKVGDFRGLNIAAIDIGTYVHRGANLLYITWRPLEDKIPTGHFHIAFAAKRNQFSELAAVSIDQGKVGTKTLTFTIPATPRPIGTTPSRPSVSPARPAAYKSSDRVRLSPASSIESQRPAAQRYGPPVNYSKND